MNRQDSRLCRRHPAGAALAWASVSAASEAADTGNVLLRDKAIGLAELLDRQQADAFWS